MNINDLPVEHTLWWYRWPNDAQYWATDMERAGREGWRYVDQVYVGKTSFVLLEKE